METGIVNALILSGLFLSLFAVAELLYHCCKVRAEFTRKIVHAGTGLLALLFPLMLDNHWWVLVLCTSFTILLICSVHFRLLRSIHAIDRRSVGSLAYPVAVYGCYLSYTFLNNQLIYYYLPILILAISDPLAALSGKRWPLGAYQIREHTRQWSVPFSFYQCLFDYAGFLPYIPVSFTGTGTAAISTPFHYHSSDRGIEP